MKKHISIIAVLFCLAAPAYSQIGVSININAQPVWGPVGYNHADYYYMPDIETYYSVSTRQYTYFDHGRWISAGVLPPRYSNYDMYHGYKAVINEPNPWMHHDRYRAQYLGYRGRHDQAVIRDSHDARYFGNPGHPNHNQWQSQHGGEHHDGDRHDGGEHHDGDRR